MQLSFLTEITLSTEKQQNKDANVHQTESWLIGSRVIQMVENGYQYLQHITAF